MKQSIMQINDKIYINGEEIKMPNNSKPSSITQIDGKVFINGYELIGGKWKITLRALFHLIF